MRNSRWLIASVVALILIAVVWAIFPRKFRDDHESWRVQQEKQTERQQNPPTSDGQRDPAKSSGEGSSSDSGRGETSVPTGTK